MNSKMNIMTRLKFYLSVLLTALTICSQGQQSGIIKGRVLDNDNLSMPGASIVLKSISKGAVSDSYGYYTITGVPVGTYELMATYIGYTPKRYKFWLNPQTTVIDFSLEAGIELSEVTVTDNCRGRLKPWTHKWTRATSPILYHPTWWAVFPTPISVMPLKEFQVSMFSMKGEARLKHKGNRAAI